MTPAERRRQELTPLQGALANVRRLRKLIKNERDERMSLLLAQAEQELGRLYADWCDK
ncbi:MAG TPA: hypothetical protein VIE65_13995 [Methylobacter sp.]|jgi:hypothetical protein